MARGKGKKGKRRGDDSDDLKSHEDSDGRSQSQKKDKKDGAKEVTPTSTGAVHAHPTPCCTTRTNAAPKGARALLRAIPKLVAQAAVAMRATRHKKACVAATAQCVP